MKKYKLLLLILFSVLITSCNQEKARFSPYTLKNFRLEGPVKSVVVEEYSKKSKLISTTKYSFDKYGRLSSQKHIEGKDTITYYLYYKNGFVENIQSAEVAFVKYTPEYNKLGDLIKETIISNSENELESGVVFVYEYDEIGNILNKTKLSLDSSYYYFHMEYEYENNRLNLIKKYESDKEIISTCTNGVVAQSKEYDKTTKKTKQSTYSYKFDNKGNWIKQDEIENKRIKSSIQRTIVYYSDDEIASTKSYTNIIFIDNYINDVLSRSASSSNSPSKILFIILVICSIALFVIGCYKFSDFILNNFAGHVGTNGMKKLWMYNWEPYVKVGSLILLALLSFILSIILMLLFGAVTWGILFLIKILLFIIVFIGWICLILGGIVVFLGKEPVGCLPFLIGILIVSCQEAINDAGTDLVIWGFEFMKNLNMFAWGWGIFANYWDVILIIFFTPMVLFLVFAVFVITINMLLNGFEFIVTRIYSIRRPCPICGSTATPDYIVGGKPHPVKLHPGVYGVFTHKSPVTGESIPTMLLNGRGKVTRKCKKCNSFINADTDNTIGTEIHIGIVGHRSSGKSYLLYSGLSSLMSSYPERFSQIDADNDTRIENKKKRIDARDGIQTDVANKYRAIQLILKSKLRPVPYHLFFYDVAGEKFNASSSSHKTAMDFYRNVQSIVFIVDPSMLDISGTPASAKFVDWHKRNANAEKYRIDGSFAVLKDILETVGRKSNKIDFNFVCTKTDIGYLPELGYSKTPGENEIERFISTELGLSNLINSARASFKNVHFYAVSAIESDKSRLKNLFITLLEQRKVLL